MASNRMYLRCKACSAELKIAVYNQPGPWDASVDTGDLTAWFADHGLMSEHEGRDYAMPDDVAGEWYELAYE